MYHKPRAVIATSRGFVISALSPCETLNGGHGNTPAYDAPRSAPTELGQGIG